MQTVCAEHVRLHNDSLYERPTAIFALSVGVSSVLFLFLSTGALGMQTERHPAMQRL